MLKAVRRRLAGEVPLGEAFFYEMLAVGSIVNIAIGLSAFAMIAADFPIWLSVIAFLSPQPYNIISVISVWRSAAESKAPAAVFMKAVAVIWFVIMVFV